MILRAMFTPGLYAHWLCAHDPQALIGVTPADDLNPIAHFINEQALIEQEQVRLDGVRTRLDLDSLTGSSATLDVRNVTFITRTSRDPDHPAPAVEYGHCPLQFCLPTWALGLVRRYTEDLISQRAAPSSRRRAGVARGRQRAHRSLADWSDEEPDDQVERGMRVTTHEALEHLAEEILRMRGDEQEKQGEREDRAGTPGGAFIWEHDEQPSMLRAEFSATEFEEWQREHPEPRPRDGEPADALGEFLAACTSSQADVITYQEGGDPKADLELFAMVMERYDAQSEYRTRAYMPAIVTLDLPPWTLHLTARRR